MALSRRRRFRESEFGTGIPDLNFDLPQFLKYAMDISMEHSSHIWEIGVSQNSDQVFRYLRIPI
jgi:hypothetical protein